MPTPKGSQYAILGAAAQEYSVAYFGFDSAEILDQFLSKYNNFVVEVDQKRKYSLEVTRALFQAMPTYKKEDQEETKGQANATSESKIEELPDYLHFQKNLGVKKPNLLPLEVQLEIEREREEAEAAAEATALQLTSSPVKIKFHEAAIEGLDEIDRQLQDMEGHFDSDDD